MFFVIFIILYMRGVITEISVMIPPNEYAFHILLTLLDE